MMPDLGKYAETVLSAYAVSLVLIVVLVLLSLRRGRKVKAQLEAVEKKVRKNG
jgi:heme exporter protein D